MNSTIGHPTDSSSSFCPTDVGVSISRYFCSLLSLFFFFLFLSFSLRQFHIPRLLLVFLTAFSFRYGSFFLLIHSGPTGTKSMSMASSPRRLPIFPFRLSSPARPCLLPSRHLLSCRDRRLFSFTRFRDYDENLTSAKVAPVRHISHFSGTGFLANAFFRLAKPELAAGCLQKSLFRHPYV